MLQPTDAIEPINVWTLPEIADAQLALVRQQLADDAAGHPPAPFAAFHRAMTFLTARIGEWFSMLDVGCGVGHYGNLIARKCPTIAYIGTDISSAMIERARKLFSPLGFHQISSTPFMRCEFEDNRFESFDVVLVSQALEMTADPVASLHLVLERARKYVLLHRLRVPPMTEPSRRTIERTYLGHTAPNMEWNLQEIEDIAKGYGEIIYTDMWDMSLTTIVEKR